MLTLFQLIASAIACAFIQTSDPTCINANETNAPAGVHGPQKTGRSIDVVLSAKSVYVWDIATGQELYEKNPDELRPIASLNKLISLLTIRQYLKPSTVVEIPPEVKRAQNLGADVGLPIGQHTTVQDLIAASAIPSANDAMVTLAIAAKGSEEEFTKTATAFAKAHGMNNTLLSTATGLSGGEQHSTARDVATALRLASADPVLKPYLSAQQGTITTLEGYKRDYKSTDKLLGTYLPIYAAKTGYTIEAGENLAIITATPSGQKIGAVVLGSEDRFSDMKVLVEWIVRNFTWN